MRKILFTILLCVCIINLQSDNKDSEYQVPEFFSAKVPTKELVYECAKHYNIRHPEIIVAQSILETGHYKSKICLEHNNLFGLYDSKNKKYFSFNSWQESVEAYKKMIQHKYKSGDYYKFLKKIGYAEDPDYINKIKGIKIC